MPKNKAGKEGEYVIKGMKGKLLFINKFFLLLLMFTNIGIVSVQTQTNNKERNNYISYKTYPWK